MDHGHPTQAASTQLPPRSCLLLAAHITCGVFCCFILWHHVLNEAPTAGVHSQLNYLGVLAQTSVCLISCASPQETQYGGYLTCCQSLRPTPCTAFPRASAAGPQLGLAHRALLPQGTTCIFPLMGFPSFPAVPCSLLWWSLYDGALPRPVSATPSSSALPPQSTNPAHLPSCMTNPFAITLLTPNS